ncbi:major facilitator superfamily domain-containing protein [Xylaria sp. FL0933]|nr:major facilitator superfamily domain-containing protein [Xylaria sp. FL0933]
MSLVSETLFVLTICVSQLCAQAGIGLTLPILKGVGSRFHVANANSLSSCIAAYTVTLGAFILTANRLGEILGNKRVFVAGLAWSAAWSLIVGASFYSTRSLFITSRAFQGLGAALTLPTGLALLRTIRGQGVHKAIVFTLYAAMSPIGLILGAFAASVLVKLAWWPWAFWTLSIALTVLGVISCSTIPSPPRARNILSGARVVTVAYDLPGMITSSTSLGSFGFAWSQAHEVGWSHAYIEVILFMSVVLAVLFIMIETCLAPRPLIPYSAMSWEVCWILVALGCGSSCFGIWIFYGWQFVEKLQSTPPLITTACFAPIVVVGCSTAVITRFILRRVGLDVMFCVALLSITIGGIIMATMQIRQTYWEQLFPSILFMAWGFYTSLPVATLMILTLVHKKHGGIAATLVCTVAHYGVGLGLGVAGTVEKSAMGGGKLTVHNRLRGHRAVYWTNVGLAGFGFVVCLAMTLASRLRLELRDNSRRVQRRR